MKAPIPTGRHCLPHKPPAQQLTQTANPHSEFNPRLDYNPQNVFNPKIDVHVPVSQSQNVGTKAKPTRDPVFECENDTRLAAYAIDWDTKTLIREAAPSDLTELPENIMAVHAVLARIQYRHDRGVERYLYLRSNIFFYNLGLELKKRVVEGIWDDDELQTSKHIHVGRALELIVALVPVGIPNMVIAAEYGQKRIENYTGRLLRG